MQRVSEWEQSDSSEKPLNHLEPNDMQPHEHQGQQPAEYGPPPAARKPRMKERRRKRRNRKPNMNHENDEAYWRSINNVAPRYRGRPEIWPVNPAPPGWHDFTTPDGRRYILPEGVSYRPPESERAEQETRRRGCGTPNCSNCGHGEEREPAELTMNPEPEIPEFESGDSFDSYEEYYRQPPAMYGPYHPEIDGPGDQPRPFYGPYPLYYPPRYPPNHYVPYQPQQQQLPPPQPEEVASGTSELFWAGLIGSTATAVIGAVSYLIYRNCFMKTKVKRSKKKRRNKKSKQKKKRKKQKKKVVVSDHADSSYSEVETVQTGQTSINTTAEPSLNVTQTPSPKSQRQSLAARPDPLDLKWEKASTAKGRKRMKMKKKGWKSKSTSASPPATYRRAQTAPPATSTRTKPKFKPAYAYIPGFNMRPPSKLNSSRTSPKAQIGAPTVSSFRRQYSEYKQPASFQRQGANLSHQDRAGSYANRSPPARKSDPRTSSSAVQRSSTRTHSKSSEYAQVQDTPKVTPQPSKTLSHKPVFSLPPSRNSLPTRMTGSTIVVSADLQHEIMNLGQTVPDVSQSREFPSLGTLKQMQEAQGSTSKVNVWAQRASTEALKKHIDERPSNMSSEMGAGGLTINLPSDNDSEIIDAMESATNSPSPNQVPDPVTPLVLKPKTFEVEATVKIPALVSASIKPQRIVQIPAVPVMLDVGTKVRITERVQKLLHVVAPVEGWIFDNTVDYNQNWFLGKHPKTQILPDHIAPRDIGISYIVPSTMPALPHITLRPEMTVSIKRATPVAMDLPEAVWCSLNMTNVAPVVAEKIHDEYVMHPPFPSTRFKMLQDCKSQYRTCSRLPINEFPQLVNQNHIVICHFYMNPQTHNQFPKTWNHAERAHNANLLLTFRPQLTSEGKLTVAIEFFVPRPIWTRMDDVTKASLFDLAKRSALDVKAIWDKDIPMSSNRMCFSHEMLELKQEQDVVIRRASVGGDINLDSTINVRRTEFFYDSYDLPSSFDLYKRAHGKPLPQTQVEPVGAVRYEGLFSDQELLMIEKNCDTIQEAAEHECLKPMTSHHTIFNGLNRRTKHFFKARYLWTREQLEEKEADRAGGLRTDVDPIPEWVEFVEDRMVAVGVVPKDFINGVALNIYHDGTLGIGLHVDCNSRFDRPIVTLRLFSPARLTLGGHLLGQNAVSVIDLPRGAVLSMLKDNYAADGVKHSVRSCDLVTKSAALILRHLWEDCLEEASQIQPEDKS